LTAGCDNPIRAYERDRHKPAWATNYRLYSRPFKCIACRGLAGLEAGAEPADALLG
jgi:hypothetical protein